MVAVAQVSCGLLVVVALHHLNLGLSWHVAHVLYGYGLRCRNLSCHVLGSRLAYHHVASRYRSGADVGLVLLRERSWQRLGSNMASPRISNCHCWLEVAQLLRQFLDCKLSQLHDVIIVLSEPLSQFPATNSLVSLNLTQPLNDQSQGL